MIYLDNNATAPLDPKIFEVISSLMTSFSGNPSSIHRYGQQARSLLNGAQRKCAEFFGVDVNEIVFTSGATEALNFFVHGIPKNCHVITSSLEHASVIEPLKASGASVSYLDPQPGKGAIDPNQILETIQNDTKFILLSAVNNETGIKTDIETIARIAEAKGVKFALDGVGYLGKECVHLPKAVSAACFSSHKIHGPHGVGVAVVRKGFKLPPLIWGGGQQRGMRSGTENLPGIVGFAKALECLDEKWVHYMKELRNRFEKGILGNLPDVIIHGQDEPRVCNTSNIAFLGVDGETLLMALDLAGLAASHGSACSSGTLQSSRVLLNMGIDPRVVRSSLRFSLSRMNTQAEIDKSIDLITETVKRLRS